MQSNRPAVLIQKKKSKTMSQEEDKNGQYTKYYGLLCAEKKCQAIKCYKKVDKNCQTSDMWPVKPKIDVQSMPRTAKLQSSYKKKDQMKYVCDDRNCQSTKLYKISECDDFKRKSLMCSDKNCQENINMQSVMPQMDMQICN